MVTLVICDALFPHEIVPNPGGGPGYACLDCRRLIRGTHCRGEVLYEYPLYGDRGWEVP